MKTENLNTFESKLDQLQFLSGCDHAVDLFVILQQEMYRELRSRIDALKDKAMPYDLADFAEVKLIRRQGDKLRTITFNQTAYVSELLEGLRMEADGGCLSQ